MHAAWRRCRVRGIGTLALFVALALFATAPVAHAEESDGVPGAADALATQTADEAVSALDASPAGGIVASVSGRGWGHGRGLGQYGALGYAIEDGWSRDQILAHFYGNTAAGSIANDLWSIRLLALDGQPTTVQVTGSGLGVSVDGVTWTYVPAHGLRLTANSSGTGFLLEAGDGCGAIFYPYLNLTGSTVHVRPALDDGFGNIAYLDATDQPLTYTLQVCTGPTSSTYYRGDIRAVLDRPDPAQPVVQRTVNALPIEQYLRGVVPREMPASWSDLGGGAGRNALQAQAVAARSYSVAENRYSYARTCDTTSCQVYSGRATWTTTAGVRVLEDARADAAIAATAGVVRSRDGQVTRTEFSSSTGGYTAGGTFPAVPDDGDDISSNPNRAWSTTLGAATIEQRYARSPLTSITVTERSGLGADGGRVVRVLLTFGDGYTIERTGNQFRIDFGLKSDWFSITLAGAPQTPFGKPLTTGYTDTEYADLTAAATYLEMTPEQLQLTGVWITAFFIGLSRNPNAVERLSPPPDSEPPIKVTTFYLPADEPPLLAVMHRWTLAPAQAQKVGAAVLTFLAGLDKARRAQAPL